MRRGAHCINLAAELLCKCPYAFEVFFCSGQVSLVADNNLRPAAQIAVVLQFGIDLFQVFHRIPAFASGNIHHVQQQPCSFHMPQKIMPQARTFRSPLDQSGNIGKHDILSEAPDDPEIRGQRRKVIIPDFRPCAGHHAED